MRTSILVTLAAGVGCLWLVLSLDLGTQSRPASRASASNVTESDVGRGTPESPAVRVPVRISAEELRAEEVGQKEPVLQPVPDWLKHAKSQCNLTEQQVLRIRRSPDLAKQLRDAWGKYSADLV